MVKVQEDSQALRCLEHQNMEFLCCNDALEVKRLIVQVRYLLEDCETKSLFVL